MSYFGTMVLARSPRRLTDEPAIAGFGTKHMWLRELGDDWQLVETLPQRGDRIDYWSTATGWPGPVLASYVNSSFCVSAIAAAPGRDPFQTHLPDPTGGCPDDEHPLGFRPVPAASVATDALEAWAIAAGLLPDRDHLAWVTNPDRRRRDVDGLQLSFELILAMGFPMITPSLEPTVDPHQPPYSTISGRSGLANIAYHEWEDSGEPLGTVAWVEQAVQLDRKIWRAVFADPGEAPDLEPEIDQVVAAYRADLERGGGPSKFVEVHGMQIKRASWNSAQLYSSEQQSAAMRSEADRAELRRITRRIDHAANLMSARQP